MRSLARSLTTSVFSVVLLFSARAGAGNAELNPTTADDKVSYAVSSICAPFVLDKVDQRSRPAWFELDGTSAPLFEGMGLTRVRAGIDGFVYLGINSTTGNRDCEILARHADPESLRIAALKALATRSERFAPTKSRYLPGRFATEDMLLTRARTQAPSS